MNTEDDKEQLFDVTIVLKSGFSRTFRMLDFEFNGSSYKWKSAPGEEKLLRFQFDEVAKVFAKEIGSAA